MKKATLILLLIMLIMPAARASDYDLEADFKELDKAVAERATYAHKKEKDIAEYKMALAGCVSYADMYRGAHKIYEQYLKYNADSAIAYADRCYAIARKGGMEAEATEAEASRALVLTLRGDNMRAGNALAAISDIGHLPPDIKAGIAVTYLEYYARHGMQRSNGGTADTHHISRTPWRKYVDCLPEGSWRRTYYTAIFTGRDLSRQLTELLRGMSQPSADAAMIYMALANIYQRRGDEQARAHCLIRSAINDIGSANHEAASLIALLYTPQIDKGSQRAANYVKACTDNVRIYKDIGRSLDIVNIHSLIAASYEKKLVRRGNAMLTVIVLLIMAIGAVVVTVIILRKRGIRQMYMLQQVRDGNYKLREMVDSAKVMQQQLREGNDRLTEEIERRNKRFLDAYWLVSQYISDVSAFKKTVFNLITAGKVDKARSMLASGSNIESLLGDFYRHFDIAFVSTHPDFIERFNSLLKPECRVTLADPQVLNPELRIYALVSIGITDSVRIAEFLHYSPQTIYNYRLKTRRNALLPGKQFAEEVASFYRKEEA